MPLPCAREVFHPSPEASPVLRDIDVSDFKVRRHFTRSLDERSIFGSPHHRSSLSVRGLRMVLAASCQLLPRLAHSVISRHVLRHSCCVAKRLAILGGSEQYTGFEAAFGVLSDESHEDRFRSIIRFVTNDVSPFECKQFRKPGLKGIKEANCVILARR